MDCCRFDLPDWVPSNGIATPQGGEIHDELQLAGFLGKTLLERNGDLEAKLKRLEEFTEETLNGNKSLARQVREYRRSLIFANRSCEQLEMRLEESELELKELKKLVHKQDATIQVKTRVVEDLQSALEKLESDNIKLQEDLTTRQGSDNSDQSSPTSPGHLARSRSYIECGQRSVKELQEVVDEMASKLSDSHYEKNRMKGTIDTVKSQNKKLKELLSKAESDIVDLHCQLKYMEEVNSAEKSEPATPVPPQSPGRRSALNSSGHTGFCPHCSENLYCDETLDETTMSSLVGKNNYSMTSGGGSDTLFNELQTELSGLQSRFDKLVKDCSCPASIPYKELVLDTPPPFVDSVGSKSQEEGTSVMGVDVATGLLKETSLKDLFEEVYTSLKKTSIVADRLLVRRKEVTDKVYL